MRFATTRRPPFAVLLASAALFAVIGACPRPALAVSGLYGQLGIGYGKFSGNSMITSKTTNDVPVIGDGCCPSAGPAAQLRLGYSLFGFGGAEFGILGNGWDIGSNTGGAGFVGGGLRAFPLQFLSLTGILDNKDFPIDIGLGAMFGWAIAGKDFA